MRTSSGSVFSLLAVLLCSQRRGRLGKHFLPCTPPVRGSFQRRTVRFWCGPALTDSALSRPEAGATRMTWCLQSNAGSSRHHVGVLSTQDDFQAPSERARSKSPQRRTNRPLNVHLRSPLCVVTNAECVSASLSALWGAAHKEPPRRTLTLIRSVLLPTTPCWSHGNSCLQ